MRALLAIVIVIVIVGAATPAHAERDFCGRDARHRGKAIDLDFQRAEIHDVLRMLAETGGVNVVIADQVRGRVTIKLRRVAWDRALCAIAAVHQLAVSAEDTILLVRPR